MKTADLLTRDLQRRLEQAGVRADFTQAETLRRAQLTLHRWAELECGDGNDFQSWAIERDEASGVPFMVIHPHTGKSHRTKIADREAGAIRRVARVCKDVGAHWYHQGDPRGCALYVAREPLTDSDYNRGVPCV